MAQKSKEIKKQKKLILRAFMLREIVRAGPKQTTQDLTGYVAPSSGYQET